ATRLDEIDLRAVHHEKWGLRIMMKEGTERLRQALQVLRGDAALEVPVALADAADEDVGPRLEVDDQVRPGHLGVEELENLPVERELVRSEGDPGEDAVLGEEVVGHGASRTDALRRQLLLLAVALEREEQLGLEGMALGVLVELPQKWVVFDSLQDEIGAELGHEPSREGRLADADGSLDRDVPPHPSVRPHPYLP